MFARRQLPCKSWETELFFQFISLRVVYHWSTLQYSHNGDTTHLYQNIQTIYTSIWRERETYMDICTCMHTHIHIHSLYVYGLYVHKLNQIYFKPLFQNVKYEVPTVFSWMSCIIKYKGIYYEQGQDSLSSSVVMPEFTYRNAHHLIINYFYFSLCNYTKKL